MRKFEIIKSQQQIDDYSIGYKAYDIYFKKRFLLYNSSRYRIDLYRIINYKLDKKRMNKMRMNFLMKVMKGVLNG